MVHLHHFSNIKVKKKHKIVEGPGSVLLINGSGSRRPKKIRIRRVGSGLHIGYDLQVYQGPQEAQSDSGYFFLRHSIVFPNCA
jgi:hypothetical protein